MILLSALFLWISLTGQDIVDRHYKDLESTVTEIDWSGVPNAKIEKLLNKEGASLAIQKKPLESVESEKFSQNTPHGKIPRIAEDGTTPFQAFRRPFSPASNKIDYPKVSIVMVDYCQSKEIAQLALNKLSADVSLALNPYCGNIDEAAQKARSLGHELWLGIPMETEGYPIDDYGPLSLLINSSVDANKSRVQKAMAKTTGYVGLLTYFNPVFTRSERDFTPVLDMIDQTGLGLFETNPAPPDYIERFAFGTKTPYAYADVIIDSRLEEFEIQSRLIELERIASDKGQATGVIRAVPLSIEMINKWSKTLSDKQILLAPLSATAGY